MPVSLNHREQRNWERGSTRACERGESENGRREIGKEGARSELRGAKGEGEKAKFVLRVDERTIY